MILFIFIQAFWLPFSVCSFFVLLDLKSDLKIVVENMLWSLYFLNTHVMTFSTCHNFYISILTCCDCATCHNSLILTHYNLHNVLIKNYEMKKWTWSIPKYVKWCNISWGSLCFKTHMHWRLIFVGIKCDVKQINTF